MFCNLTTWVNQDAREFVIKNPRLFARSRGISTLYCTIQVNGTFFDKLRANKKKERDIGV